MEEEKKVNKSFIEEHPKLFFWIRFCLWTLFAVVLPFLFIGLRFDIFKKASKFSLSGWGIIGVAIVVIFLLVLINYIKKAMQTKNVFVAQCISGGCRIVLPLVALCFIIKICVDDLELILQVLCCLTICEAIAIPINPMPAWVEKCRQEKPENKEKDDFDIITDALFKKKDDGDKK